MSSQGSTLTLRAMVAKNPANQANTFSRYAVKLDGDSLTITNFETQRGKTQYPSTLKLVRIE